MASSKPPSDDLDRREFYLTRPDNSDDGDEYELEGPDAELLAAEEHRAKESIAAVEQSIDVDELMREDDRRLDIEILDEWMRNLRFRFQVKHLLAATAIVAILVAVARHGIGSMLLLALVVVIGGALAYLAWKQREHEAAMEERRRQLYAQRRMHHRRQFPVPGIATSAASVAPGAATAEPKEFAAQTTEHAGPSFAQSLVGMCSPKELVVASAIAMTLLGLLGALFGAGVTATLLGIIALVGLVAQAAGYDMPRIVALGWWLLLVLYVLLNILLAIWGTK